MSPSDASRPARLSAFAAPFVRSTSTAFSRSPAVSSRAFLQSIMPAPVRARSAATSLAGISFTIDTPPPPHENAALAPLGSEGGGRLCTGTRSVPACSAFASASAARFRRGGGRGLVRLEPCRDRFRLGATLAPRRLLLLVPLRLRLDTGLRRVRHPFAFLRRLAQRHLLPRFPDDVGDGRGDERNRPDPIVVAGAPDGDRLRVRVRVDDGDYRNAELVRLGDRDALLLRIHDEQRPGQPAHVLDPRQVLLQLDALALEQQLLLLGVVLELAFGGALLQLLQPLDLLLDGLEVGQRAAQPALGHV